MGVCQCFGRCCAELGALTFALISLGLNVVDLSLSICLLVGAFSNLYGTFVSGIVVTSYASYLIILIALVNSIGIMRQPGRLLLTVTLCTTTMALLIEFTFVSVLAYYGKQKFVRIIDLDRHAPTGSTVYWLLGNAWMLAVLACRHVLRYLVTLFLRNIRDGIVNRNHLDASRQDNFETQDLSERLIQREIRREEREDLRAHFNHKYFGGRNAQGESTPSPLERNNSERENLPDFILSSHRQNLTSPSENSTPDWAV